MTDDEKTILLALMMLLENATSNALDPVHRQSWKEDRDFIVRELKEMVR